MRHFRWLYIFLLVALGSFSIIGCAGSEQATTDTSASADTTAQKDTTAPAGPSLQVLTLENSGVMYKNARTGDSREIAAAEAYVGPRELSPEGDHLAFAYAGGDSVHLGIIDLATRELQRVHTSSSGTEYSLAWSSTGDTLAFGYFSRTSDGEMGPGAISIAEVNGSVRSVGCSAARKVLKWLPSGNLSVRDPENLYVVTADGCETLSTLDIRKMHKITYAPDGERMAYIFRDLVYDRENGEYVPDSTLFISNARGGEKNEIFGDPYRARHLQWSSDGSQLAFDVRSEADRSRRQVIIYNAVDDRRTYLVPPQMAGSGDELHPRWSPSDDNIAFVLRRGKKTHAAVQVMGQTRTLGRTDGPVWGWAGERQVVVRAPDSTRVVDFQGSTVHAISAEHTLLHVWPSPSDP